MQEKEKDRTLELIKQQYLGGEKQKKKVMRPTEKFRFNFDWEAADDTSRVSHSLRTHCGHDTPTVRSQR